MRSLLAAIVALLLFPTTAVFSQPGCRTISPGRLLEEFDTVFAGNFLGFKSLGGREIVTAQVAENFRNAVVGSTLDLNYQPMDCGAKMEPGKTYLFAVKTESSGEEIPTAYGFASIEQNPLYLAIVRRLAAGFIDGAAVGRVEIFTDNGISKTFPNSENFEVSIANGYGQTLTSEVSQDGYFYFEGLADGEYTARLNYPLGFEPAGDSGVNRTFKIEKRFLNVIIGFALKFSGKIKGFVRDADGRSLPGMHVVLYPAEGVHRRIPVAAADTDSEGRYQFDRLPPGRYVIAAFPVNDRERQRGPSRMRPDAASEFTLVYYPTTRDRAAAGVVDLTSGKPVTNAALTAVKLQKRPVRGRVLDRDGKPAVDAEIRLYSRRVSGGLPTPFDTRVVAKTDIKGSFEFEAFEETENTVQAFVWSILPNGERTMRFGSNCVTLPEKGEVPPIELKREVRSGLLIDRQTCGGGGRVVFGP